MHGPLRLTYALLANYMAKCQMSSGSYGPIFILVLIAFTVCLGRELHRHRHERKFPQGSETVQNDAYIGPKPGVEHNRLFPEY